MTQEFLRSLTNTNIRSFRTKAYYSWRLRNQVYFLTSHPPWVKLLDSVGQMMVHIAQSSMQNIIQRLRLKKRASFYKNSLQICREFFYLFPFARLCDLQSISQFPIFVPPHLLHAETWSASISASFHILFLFASCPIAQYRQFEIPLLSASAVCLV